MAVVGQNIEQADVKHHVFCMWFEIRINPSDFRCLSEQKYKDKAIKSN